jgi:predicted DCC family thiol-disulfide oxidoreductase YuxK
MVFSNQMQWKVGMKQLEDEKLHVYFNSACPVCKAGINAQKSKTTGCDVSWNDIHINNRCALEADPDIDVVRKYLHVIDRNGQKHVGIEAFIQLWKYSPREHWKAKLFALPIVKPIAKAFYVVFANILFALNRLVIN